MALEDNRYRLHEQVAFFHAYHYFLQGKGEIRELYKYFFLNGQKDDMSKEEHEKLFRFAIGDFQAMLIMQQFICLYEFLKDDHSLKIAKFKNDFMKLKVKADVNGKLKEINPSQLLKIIRNCLAHNDDSSNDYTWNMDCDNNLVINYSHKKAEIIIKLTTKDLESLFNIYRVNFCDSLTRVKVTSYETKLKNAYLKKTLNSNNIHKYVSCYDTQTNTNIFLDKYQKKALYNFYSNQDMYHPKYIVGMQFSPLCVINISWQFPQKMNHLSVMNDCQLLVCCLFYLAENKPLTREEYRAKILNNVSVNYPGFSQFLVYSLEVTNKFSSILVANMLFSIFSCIGIDKVEKYFPSNVDVNRIRNSLMHGRFFYNNDYGFEFYDGVLDSDKSKSINRIEDKIEHIATLTFEDIDLISQLILADYYNKNSNLQNRS